MKEKVINYFSQKPDYSIAFNLFLLIKGNDHPLARFQHKPVKGALQALHIELARYAGVMPTKTAQKAIIKGRSLREDYPFLSDADCPPELKILAANKITAYHNYTNGHRQLFACNNNKQQFEAVKYVVENYIENRSIFNEFEYYKKHKSVLGLHPIFKAYQDIIALRKMGVLELVKLQGNTVKNIGRIKSLINKNTQPHLRVEREASLQEKQNHLAEIERILKTYA